MLLNAIILLQQQLSYLIDFFATHYLLFCCDPEITKPGMAPGLIMMMV